MESNETSTLPNPNNYLAFLTVKMAAEYELSRNIYIGTLGALIWDMLIALPQEFRLLAGGISPVIIAYFLSRISAFFFVLLSVIAKTRPMPNCTALEYAITSCWAFGVSSSSFLFLRRVQALYAESRIVIYSFWGLYIANVAVSILVPIGSRSAPIATTGYCVNESIQHYVAAVAFMSLAFDTSVFSFVSYKIATEHGKPGRRVTLRTLITGEAFPRLSKAILQGGQQYYLLTVILNILVSVLIATPSIPPIYEATFSIPDIAVTSSMACRVYRNLRMTGGDSESKAVETNTDLKFGPMTPKSKHVGNITTQGIWTTMNDIWIKSKPEDIELALVNGTSTSGGRLHNGSLYQQSNTTGFHENS